jgi:gluconate kinase
MLIILFGLAGSGKNFVGDILAKQFNYYFWDADRSLPEEVQQSIREKKSFTQSMRNQITDMVIQETTKLLLTHQKLVVAQALYKEANREMLRQKFPDALFIHVQADPEIILQRLKQRGSVVDQEYARTIAINFEEPHFRHEKIINNKDEKTILTQLVSILAG